MYSYGYGAPPPPYGAPQAPAPYAPSPYSGAPPAPYGAPPAPYGAPPYGYQPLPSGAPLPPYGAVPAPYGASPSFSAAAPQHSSALGSTPSTASAQQWHEPSAPPAPSTQLAPGQGAGYPTLTAPPPHQTVPSMDTSSGTTGNMGGSQQRPSSAYPTFGGSSTVHGPGAGSATATHALSRPATASTSPSAFTYGAPYGTAPYSPQPPTAAYTYGQPTQSAPSTALSHPAAAASPVPYMPPTTYSPSPGHGTRRRRAVLVGCSYPGSSAALNGCLNDVDCILFCLKQRFGFTDQQIVVLRDDRGRHADFTSTRANIMRAIQWLMTDQRHGDSLFFHFSGHGSQQYDRNGDEEDGHDETICPTDFKYAGQIVDDELNRMLVRPLMPGVTLHAVIDACHSGTALDLPFRAKVDGAGRWYWKGRARHDKMTAGGTAFQFGACKDSQVAQDTNKLSGYAYTGAATYCFIQAIEKYGVNQTYGQVLGHMSATLRATTGAPGINLGSAGSLIAGILLGSAASLLTAGGGQTPVLSCDKQVDLYSATLSL